MNSCLTGRLVATLQQEPAAAGWGMLLGWGGWVVVVSSLRDGLAFWTEPAPRVSRTPSSRSVLTATGGSCCAGCLMIISRCGRIREQRLEQVTGDEGVARGRVESGHARALESVFGTVSVEPLAYRAPGLGNLHPADAVLNLPVERHSHGLRKLAALEAARGSFQDAMNFED